MNEWAQLISTLGFPIISAVALFFGCKYLLEMQQKNTDKMFAMYEKSSEENRKAIEQNTKVIETLCDKLDREGL